MKNYADLGVCLIAIASSSICIDRIQAGQSWILDSKPGIQDSTLCKYRVYGPLIELDSGFQSPGYRIRQEKFPGFRIPQDKNFPDSGVSLIQ